MVSDDRRNRADLRKVGALPVTATSRLDAAPQPENTRVTIGQRVLCCGPAL